MKFVSPRFPVRSHGNAHARAATAAMFAAQDGLVDLDEPITAYLLDFHVNSIFEEHPEQNNTLRMLLNVRGFSCTLGRRQPPSLHD